LAQLIRETLGNPASARDDKGDAGSGMTKHFDQAINAESVDLAANQITDPWLRHTQEFGSSRLRQTAGFNQFRQLNHQVGANPQVLRLFCAESQVSEDVASGSSSSNGHGSSLLHASAQDLDLPESLSSQRQIRSTGLPAPLFESVQDVYRIFEFGQIDNSVFRPSVDSNLNRSYADRRQRLVITRHQAALDPPQLIPRSPAGIRRKRTNRFQGGADPDQRFVSHGANIQKYVYAVNGCLTRECSCHPAPLSAESAIIIKSIAARTAGVTRRAKHVAHRPAELGGRGRFAGRSMDAVMPRGQEGSAIVRIEGVPFTTTDWKRIPATEHPGTTGMALWRTVEQGNVRVRMVEYSPGYEADHWCHRGHVLLVLEGELVTELEDGTQTVLRAGTSYQVADGAAAHRSRTQSGAKLFIVD
jgi:hypothetical protein